MQSNIFLLTGKGIEYYRLQQQELDGFIQIGDGKSLLQESDLERCQQHQSKVGIIYAHGGLDNCNHLPKSRIPFIKLIASEHLTADTIVLLQKKLDIKHFYLFSCYSGAVPYHLFELKNSLKENTTITVFSNVEKGLCSHVEGVLRKIQSFYLEHQSYPTAEIERKFYYENVLSFPWPSVRCELTDLEGQKKFNAFKVKVPKSLQDINDFEHYFAKKDRLKPLIIEDHSKFQEWIERGNQKKLDFNLAEYKDLALLDSVHRNKFERACEWIKMGASINLDPTLSIIDESALCCACAEAYFPLAQMLIEKNADINQERDNGYTPLLMAAQNGHEEIIELLINAGANINHQAHNGVSALYCGAKNGHKEIVQKLIGCGTNLELKWNNSAIHVAAMYGHDEIVRMLHNAGSNLNMQNETGYTPLFLACQEGHPEVAKFLIDQGAKIDFPSPQGATALLVASQEGHRAIVEILILSGADIYSTMNNGITALHLASALGHKGIVEDLLIQYRLQRKTIEPTDLVGMTPLLYAVSRGHFEVVKKLVEAGANINHCNNDCENAYYLAFMNDHYEMAKFLKSARKSQEKNKT